jgi:hypothetical protein
MHHFFLICLFFMALCACGVQQTHVPANAPIQAELVQHTPTVLPIPTATRMFVTATAAIFQVPTNTALPTADMSIAAAQVSAAVEATAILWSGVIDRSVFKQVISQEMTRNARFSTGRYDTQFQLSNRPILIAAYFYEVSPGGQRHGRFLMYDRGGKRSSEVFAPFLFKFDLPLAWVGEHEEYGNYDSIIAKMEREFREPLVQNFLQIVVMSELECQGEIIPFCEQLKASGINLPSDASTAEAMVMDQIAAARQTTNQNWPDIAAVSELAEQGPEWWNDSHIPLLALPRVTSCISENRCATFINMELAIDMALGDP